jgi:prevent-host-death family protein
MEQRISAWEARRQFGKVLNDVTRNHSSVIVESHGEEVAVVIPIEDYRNWREQRESWFRRLREISERVNMSEEEGEALGIEAMEWDRSQADS